jgi:hypothetical protein
MAGGINHLPFLFAFNSYYSDGNDANMAQKIG